ncbi:MAG: chloride channel protein [Litorilinea sp.]
MSALKLPGFLHLENNETVRRLIGWHPPEEVTLVSAAVVVGIGTGLGAMIFIWLLGQIAGITAWLQISIGTISGLLLAMIGSGLIVGYMISHWASEAKGHGVPEVMEAVAMRGGRIRARVAAIKVLASSLTIGVGGSAGREGPIVQVGSALGSSIGQLLHFSNERVRTLVACGAAAGIAATFNAPIAGSVFALEVILGTFTVRNFGVVIMSAVSASVVSHAFLGNRPAFAVPAYPLTHVGELPIYLLLGVVAAVVAVGFIHILYRMEGLFDGWHISQSLKAAIGMGATALVALLSPELQVLGPGLHLIGETIAENFALPLTTMAALLVLKVLATSFTLGAGNSGGVFAPGLFIGAVLGGIVGNIAHDLWPNIAVNPGAYAIVGMAAVFAAAARAPMTSILIVFEMSNDYKLILPLMLATGLSTLLAERLLPYSIYTLKLKLKGITLQGGRDIDVLQGVMVGEVMAQAFTTVPVGMTLPDLSDLFSSTRRHGLMVLDHEGNLWGLVTITDLDRAVAEEMPRRTPVSEIGTPRSRLVIAHPDETAGEVLARMGMRGYGRLPVVSRENPNWLQGVIRRDDIIRAYNIALARRAELQHRTQRVQQRNIDGTEFIDVTLELADQVVGMSIQEIAPMLPEDALFVSIRRDGKVLIPHGTTTLQSGDLVTAFIRSQDTEHYLHYLKRGAVPGA